MRHRDVVRPKSAPVSRDDAPASAVQPGVAAMLALQRDVGNAGTTLLLRRKTDDVFKNAPDTRDWHRDQRWREYKARQLKEKPDDAGSGGGFKEPLASQAIDELIDKGGAELEEAFSFYKIPKIEKIGENETAAQRALLEIQSASSKTREYLEYFNKSVDYVKRYGGEIDLGPMLTKMRGLTGEVTKRLQQVENLVDDVEDARVLMVSVAKFTGAMRSGPLTRENADAFIDAAEDLYNGIQPYAEKARQAAGSAAMGGSAVAARAFLLIGFVTFEVEAGLSLLKAGKQAADKWNKRNEEYLDDAWEAEMRRERRAREAEEARAAAEAERIRSKPVEPAPWMTRAEELAMNAASQKHRREYELRHRWAAQRDQDRRWAIQYFQAELWPKRYAARRSQLRRTLRNYFDYLAVGGERTDNKVIGPGDDAWIWREVVKPANASQKQVRGEIAKFEEMRRGHWMAWDDTKRRYVEDKGRGGCPYYQKLYNEELDRYLASAGLSW